MKNCWFWFFWLWHKHRQSSPNQSGNPFLMLGIVNYLTLQPIYDVRNYHEIVVTIHIWTIWNHQQSHLLLSAIWCPKSSPNTNTTIHIWCPKSPPTSCDIYYLISDIPTISTWHSIFDVRNHQLHMTFNNCCPK
jgi:hypothetical protein